MSEKELEELESQLQLGQLHEVRARLESVSTLQFDRPTKVLLRTLRLLRRVGLFDNGLKLVHSIENPSDEVKFEKALLLGELGAIAAAMHELKYLERTGIPQELTFDVQFHLGNFHSIKREFAASAECFKRLEATPGLSELQSAIARLNRLGAEIYAQNPDPAITRELEEFAEHARSKRLFLMEQGAFYFLGHGYWNQGYEDRARKAVRTALDLKVTHRLRETLMLTLLGLEVGEIEGLDTKSLHNDILSQDHAVYWDQLNWLVANGKLSGMESERERLSSIRKLLLHDSGNIYCQRAAAIASFAQNKAVWRISAGAPELMTRAQLSRTLKASDELPALNSKAGLKSLGTSLSKQALEIFETLLRRQEFGMREAELWERVWQQPFHAISSPDALRKALERLKKDPALSDAIGIERVGRRLRLHVNKPYQILLQAARG